MFKEFGFGAGGGESMAQKYLAPPLCPGGADEDKMQENAHNVREVLRKQLGSGARLPLFGLDVLDEDPRADRVLAKFLAACNGDSSRAASMITSARHWRDTTKADSATQMQARQPLSSTAELLDACDETNQPVLLFRYAALSQPEAWNAAFASPHDHSAGQNLMREWMRVIETGIERRLSFIAGKGPTAFTVVHDLRNCRTSSFVASSAACHVLSRVVKQLLDAYPEMSARHITLGAPYYTSAMLGTVAGNLPSATRAKIVHASNGDELHTLTRFIRVEHLPVELGGFLNILPTEAKIGRKPVDSTPREVARLRCRDSGTLRCCVAMLRGSADVGLFVVEDSDAKERLPTAQGYAHAGGDPCYVDTDVRVGSTVALYISSQSYFYSADACFALGRAPPAEANEGEASYAA